MKILSFILVSLALSGCAIDSAITQADRICNATTQTKDGYRDCMNNEWQSIKDTADQLLEQVAK